MTSKKSIPSNDDGKMSPHTAEMLSEQQAAYQKSEVQHFHVEDKAQVARRVHTNGSTPRKSS